MRPVYGVLLLALAACALVYLADRFFRNRGHRASGPGFRERLRGWLDAVSGYEEEWEGDIKDGRDVIEAVEQAAGMCPNCHRSGYLNGLCGRCGYGYGYQPRPASDIAESQITEIYAPGRVPVTQAADPDVTDVFAAPRLCAGREPVYVPVAQRWITPKGVMPLAAVSDSVHTGRLVDVPRPGSEANWVNPAGPGHLQPEYVPRPGRAGAEASAGEVLLSEDRSSSAGPGHFQPPDHIRQQVRALMAEYFPPPRIAIEAS